ncbi:MAG: uroporphyrinogen decarboxylase [Thermoleophilia bacterium]|nr:uroporphyrinogen decarboxylase [Thermoleophilia bacterium]
MSAGLTLFDERLARLNKAIRLEPVDRVPVVYMGLAFSPRYMGMPMSKYVVDGDAALEAGLATADRLGDVDGFNTFPGWIVRYDLTGLWLSRIALPGQELPEDSLWQVREAEVMTEDDYDAILDQGWPAFLEGYLPRVIDMDEFLAYDAWYNNALPAAMDRARERGYPSVAVGGTTIPFEPLCGGRSMPTFFADLYRRPEKVKAVMDVMLPHMIELGISSAAPDYAPGLWVGGWRAASAMLAPRIWDKLVFPYYVQIVEAMHAQGLVSVLHLDQDWTRDLARLRELPAGSCILNPDGMTDVRKAKEILGDRMAIMGDVPATLFAAGTPDDIFAYVRDLVRDVGPTGLILCPGCDAPINTKPENMEAFVAAAHEFGVTASA